MNLARQPLITSKKLQKLRLLDLFFKLIYMIGAFGKTCYYLQSTS